MKSQFLCAFATSIIVGVVLSLVWMAESSLEEWASAQARSADGFMVSFLRGECIFGNGQTRRVPALIEAEYGMNPSPARRRETTSIALSEAESRVLQFSPLNLQRDSLSRLSEPSDSLVHAWGMFADVQIVYRAVTKEMLEPWQQSGISAEYPAFDASGGGERANVHVSRDD